MATEPAMQDHRPDLPDRSRIGSQVEKLRSCDLDFKIFGNLLQFYQP